MPTSRNITRADGFLECEPMVWQCDLRWIAGRALIRITGFYLSETEPGRAQRVVNDNGR
jgi:hypothetical protein